MNCMEQMVERIDLSHVVFKETQVDVAEQLFVLVFILQAAYSLLE